MDITEKEIQSADIDRLIGRDKWKPFLKHSCYLILIIALILSIYITVYFVKQRAFRIAFRNFSKPGNGYDIAACLVLIICLFIPSYSPELGRKYKIAILPLLLLCILYLSAFLIRISIKKRFKFSEYLIALYSAYICAGIGLYANVLFSKDKFHRSWGIIISIFFFLVCLLLFVFVMELFDPYDPVLILIFKIEASISFYFNFDVFYMIEKRNKLYRVSDGFLGFIHIHTDFFYRFWQDFFDNTIEDLDTSVMSNRASIKAEFLNRSNLETIDEEIKSQSSKDDN